MKIRFLCLNDCFIYEQLQLEEAILRTSEDNWILCNMGSAGAIVMGLSQKADEHVNDYNTLPLIQRFSGGGCVVVDQNTFFLTFIFNKHELAFKPYPEPMYRYLLAFLRTMLNLPIELRETDYVIKDKKIIGNAQSITKNKFLHHMTLLYDLDPQKMSLLKQPNKAPLYRNNRSHMEFLCTLKENGITQKTLFEQCSLTVMSHFDLVPTSFEQAKAYISKEHRKSTRLLNVSTTSDLISNV
jgi:lipoate-protein ligase A